MSNPHLNGSPDAEPDAAIHPSTQGAAHKSSTWFSLPLGDGILALEPKQALREQFPAVFAAAGQPAHMAVFTRHEMKGRLQCEVVAYFTPAAHALARHMGAHPCAQPTFPELELLVGDVDAAMLFWQ